MKPIDTHRDKLTSQMRTCYVFEESRTIADLVRPGELTPWWTITRINVPEKRRGEGLGTKMLRLILQEADAKNITLALEPLPSGPLDYDQLVAWYRRHGFRRHCSACNAAGYLVRKPQPKSTQPEVQS